MSIEAWQRISKLIQLGGILYRTARTSQAASAQFRTSLLRLLCPQLFGSSPCMLALEQQELEGSRICHPVQHNVAALERMVTLFVPRTLFCGCEPPAALRVPHFGGCLIRRMREMQR